MPYPPSPRFPSSSGFLSVVLWVKGSATQSGQVRAVSDMLHFFQRIRIVGLIIISTSFCKFLCASVSVSVLPSLSCVSHS